ncbi:MAG: YfhO family protein [Syntrophales bacterium]
MNESPSTIKFSCTIAFIILMAVTMAMFGDVLFSFKDVVLSKEGTDLSQQFIYWRDFGFGQMKMGNLPLWNPHIFSGVPFLGGFQSALLYPPNLVYLIFPLSRAINIGIALHVFLLGFFMYLWMIKRNLHPLACLLASVLIMFSGAHFMHIYAGHLSNLCAMVWVPLIFLAVDGLFENRSFRWCFLGVFAVAMQILAGHPQYVYYTAIAVFIYAGLLLFKSERWTAFVLGLLGMYIGAAALSAVQILSGIEAAGESIRSSGVSLEFASMFSFPPENFLTLVAPRFFGDMEEFPYWGRCYLWEMSLFVGVTGLSLAVYGAFSGDHKIRRFSVTMVLILLMLALGAHTPLFRILYNWLPGFDKFRGTSKFIFPASLFLVMLSGIGFDHLIRYGRYLAKSFIFLLMSGAIIGGVAFWILTSTQVSGTAGIWPEMISAVSSSGESYMPSQIYTEPAFIPMAGYFASKNLFLSAAICLFLSVLFLLRKNSEKVVYLIAILALIEIITFAKMARPTFDLDSQKIPALTKFYAAHPGDYRILNLSSPNSAMSMGVEDIWGYDPGVLKRYTQFMAFTQNQDPEKATQYIRFHRYHRLFNMLRCKYVIMSDQDQIRVEENVDVMPRLLLIQDWQVIDNRDDIFKAMERETFDPRRVVILEESPEPKPVKSADEGSMFVENSGTDHLTIKAELSHPAILLVTDAYSKGWHARPLPGSVQKNYHLMPANYTLMAIPLSAGKHHLRIEYSPLSFRVGAWISIAAVIIYLALLVFYRRKHHRERKAH